MIIDILLKDTNIITFDEFISIDYKAQSSDENEIILGNCSSASLNFTIYNNDKHYNVYRFKDTIAFLYEDETRINKLGEFNIETVKKSNFSISFTATDYMTNFDINFGGITTPYTLFDLLKKMCVQIGVSLYNTEITNGDLEFNSVDGITGKSCRNILKYICEVGGYYAIFDKDGQLKLDWYDLSNVNTTIKYNELDRFDRDEEELQITGLSYTIEDEEEFIGNKSGYDLYLTNNNPLLIQLSKEKRLEVLNNVLDKVNGMYYLSCDITIPFNSNINIGDTIKVEDEDGVEYKIIVSYMNIKNLYTMDITSSGENINRNYNNNTSSGASGSQSSNQKVKSGKDENWKDINIENLYTNTYLNGISAFGISEKSSVIINYSISFVCDSEINIKFKLLINDIENKVIDYKTKIGFNTFSWNEQADLNFSSETNVFKFLIDTSNLTEDFLINIEKNKSVLTIWAVGCETDSGGRISNIELRENIKGISLLGFNFKDILFKNINDTVSLIDIEPIKSEISEQLNALEFNRRKTNMTLDTINISIETNI